MQEESGGGRRGRKKERTREREREREREKERDAERDAERGRNDARSLGPAGATLLLVLSLSVLSFDHEPTATSRRRLGASRRIKGRGA